MCTVSFYKDNSKVIITSNRDEHIDRPVAFEPKKIIYNEKPLYFPQDTQSGGTWFVVNAASEVFVLLNGAETKHIPNPPYKKSRGMIPLELASASNFDRAWRDIDLLNLEPFTIVVFVHHTLAQIRWDGEHKTRQVLNNDKAHIWSSATLYEPNIIQERKSLFKNFISSKNNFVNEDDLIQFHTTTKIEDLENGLIINRNQEMLTKSVTQCVLKKNQFTITHSDLISNTNYQLIEYL